METHGYSGRISKSAQVHTNDPQDRILNIVLEGNVRQAVSVTPPSIYLEGQKGQALTGSVVIRGDKPLRLEQVSYNLQDQIKYTMEEVEPGKVYRLHFSNAPELSGIVTGTLVLKTGYPEKPEVIIRVRGKFMN